MRAIMARLRGPRLSPGDRVDAVLARRCSLECADPGPHYHRGDDELVRVSGARVLPGVVYALGDPAGPVPIGRMRRPETRSYQDAVYEALDQVHKLGLDGDLGMPSMVSRDVADAIRYVYAQGWLANESRLASPNMADQIDLAITTPASVVERRPGETEQGHIVHAIQQTVAYGPKGEPRR